MKHLKEETAFYHQVIGLDILEETADYSLLGVDSKPLVRLQKVEGR